MIPKDMGEMPGKRFAVIIDEAHSSQSGETSKGWKSVLSVEVIWKRKRARRRNRRPRRQDQRGGQEAWASAERQHLCLHRHAQAKDAGVVRRQLDNGKFDAFSKYTMRQAIEEKFILDVLQNYTTYKAYWSLLKKIKDDPRYERKKAYALLRSFVDHHEATIRKKVKIMVDHFMNQSMGRIGGKAKAMIVCRSRPQAVLYKRLVDTYLKQGQAVQDLGCLFRHGEVQGRRVHRIWHEQHPGRDRRYQTADAFKRDEYRFLIVANKFQTGFDQPLLHTMYVDKKLGGVNAVQTLSRLNRTCPNKEETVVLDFANEADELQKAFAPTMTARC